MNMNKSIYPLSHLIVKWLFLFYQYCWKAKSQQWYINIVHLTSDKILTDEIYYFTFSHFSGKIELI